MGQVSDALWPQIVDDDGSGESGTPANKATIDLIRAAIDNECWDEANPEVAAKDIIGEVVTARSGFDDLNARISALEGASGGSTDPATISELMAAIGPGNWAGNDDFTVWAAGDAVAPTLYAVTGGTIARSTAHWKVGPPHSAALTYSSTPCTLTQAIVPTISASNASILRGRTFGWGVWIWTATANIAGVKINDGIADSSLGTDSAGHDRHPGTSGWVWFSGVHTLASGATALSIKLDMIGAGVAWYDGVTIFPSDTPPSHWVPCPTQYGTVGFGYPGTLPLGQTTGSAHVEVDTFEPSRCGIIKDVRLGVGSAPATTDTIVDVQMHDGAGSADADFPSAFASTATMPKVAAGALAGSAQPNTATYKNKCFQGCFGATTPVSGRMRAAIRQTDGTTPGTNLKVYVRVLQYNRPQERFLAYNE